MNFTPQERERYEAEQVTFSEFHPDCDAGRWSVQGSLTLHCIECCPSPPLSPSQIEEISRLLSRARRTQKSSRPRPEREFSRRMVHVNDADWKRANDIAAARGEDISAVLRGAFKDYISDHHRSDSE
jgi:hypothetical protein